MQQVHTKKAHQAPKFRFGDTAMPLRIATIAVVSVFAFIAFAGTIRYEIQQPKTNTPNQGSQNTPVQDVPNTNTNTNPNITQPQTNQNSSSSSTTSCNSTSRATYTSQYNTRIAQENARHNAEVSFLTTTSAPASAFATENATHTANLNTISAQYQSNLRSIGC